MFSDCSTIQELNAKRISMLKSDISHIEINRAFNIKRREILESSKTFKRLTKMVPTPHQPVIYNGCYYKSASNKPNTIIFSEGGFYA